MTIEAVAAAVISFIALKTSEGFVQRAGERLFERIEETIQNVRQKIKGDVYAELTLERDMEKPESEGRKAALQEVLIEKMEEDDAFAENLRQLVQEAKQVDTNNILALGDRSVAIGGDIKDSTIITGDSNVVGGGISQSIKATDGSKISGVNQIGGSPKESGRKD